MLDINKELEKFNRLLEELDAAPDKPVDLDDAQGAEGTGPTPVTAARTSSTGESPAPKTAKAPDAPQQGSTATPEGDRPQAAQTSSHVELPSRLSPSSSPDDHIRAHTTDQPGVDLPPRAEWRRRPITTVGTTGDRLFDPADSADGDTVKGDAESKTADGPHIPGNEEVIRTESDAEQQRRAESARPVMPKHPQPLSDGMAQEKRETKPVSESPTADATEMETGARAEEGLHAKRVSPRAKSVAEDRPVHRRDVAHTGAANSPSAVDRADAGPVPPEKGEDDPTDSFFRDEPEDIDRLIQGARRALSQMDAVRRSDEVLSRNAGNRNRRTEPITIDSSASRRRSNSVGLRSVSLIRENVGAVAGGLAVAATLVCGMFIVPGLLQESDRSGLPLTGEYESEEIGHHYSSLDPAFGDENAALSISTYPNGARVFLNDELVGVTPFEGIPVTKGEYNLMIEKPDFSRIDTTFAFDADHQYFFLLEAERAGSTVSATSAGTTDLVASSSSLAAGSSAALKANSRRAPIEAPVGPAYVDASSSSAKSLASRQTAARSTAGGGRTAAAAEVKRVRQPKVRSAARAAAIVTSTPAGASVFLNDNFVGNTPVAMGDLEPGASTLTFQMEGYEVQSRDVELLPAIQVPFHATLTPSAVSATFDIRPSGDLYVDGQLVESGVSGRYQTDLTVGGHSVRVVNPDFGPWSGSIQVSPGGASLVSVDLEEAAYEAAMQSGIERVDKGELAEALVFFRKAVTLRPQDQAARERIAVTERAINERGALNNQPSRPTVEDGVYNVAETPPVLIGGLSELHRKVDYPAAAAKAGIEGRVYVEFVVDESGHVLNPKVTKGLPMGCNDAAVRAVQQARFKPGTIDGNAVKVRQTLFINFQLD